MESSSNADARSTEEFVNTSTSNVEFSSIRPGTCVAYTGAGGGGGYIHEGGRGGGGGGVWECRWTNFKREAGPERGKKKETGADLRHRKATSK